MYKKKGAHSPSMSFPTSPVSSDAPEPEREEIPVRELKGVVIQCLEELA